MAKYRKNPVEIEAIQLLPDTVEDCYAFIGAKGNFPESGMGIDPSDGQFKITTLEGVMVANIGDYIIKGIEGEYYPCKPNIFEKTYTLIGTSRIAIENEIKTLNESMENARQKLRDCIRQEKIKESGIDIGDEVTWIEKCNRFHGKVVDINIHGAYEVLQYNKNGNLGKRTRTLWRSQHSNSLQKISPLNKPNAISDLFPTADKEL